MSVTVLLAWAPMVERLRDWENERVNRKHTPEHWTKSYKWTTTNTTRRRLIWGQFVLKLKNRRASQWHVNWDYTRNPCHVKLGPFGHACIHLPPILFGTREPKYGSVLARGLHWAPIVTVWYMRGVAEAQESGLRRMGEGGRPAWPWALLFHVE